MTNPFVADSSVAIAWVHPTQMTEMTRRLLENAKEGAEVHVPAIWHLEVANALLVAVRRKLMAESHRQAGLALLNQLKLVVDHETSVMAFSTTSSLAVQNSLSVYDASYLELAQRRSLPLGTRDEPLKSAAKKSGVKVL